MKTLQKLLSVLLIFNALALSAQQMTFTGKVLGPDGTTLPGVSLVVKGTSNGVVSDVDGNFSLKASRGDVITVSCIGYKTREITLGQQASLNVTLQEDNTILDDAIVVGYGKQSRRLITSSVAKLGGEEVQKTQVSQLGESLKGKIAGLRVTQTDNSPGGSFTFQVRGGSSINGSNSPLVLVDGVETSLDAVDANDIESINVLKDAASSAIYGARASNGIILVTTKAGSYDKAPKITFEATVSHQNIEAKQNYLGAEDWLSFTRPSLAEYLEISNRAATAKSLLTGTESFGSGNTDASWNSTRYYDGGEIPEGWKTMPDPIDPSKTLLFSDTDWQSVLFRPTIWQKYRVGIDGGSRNVRYNASLGYTTDDGVALGTGYDRFSGRLSLETKLTEKLTANFQTDFSRQVTEAFPSQRQMIARVFYANGPTTKLYFPDGTPTPGRNNSSMNPLFYDRYYDRSTTKDITTLNGGLSYQFTDWLSAHVRGSFSTTRTTFKQFILANKYATDRRTSYEHEVGERRQMETYLALEKTFGGHTISATGGYSYQRRDYAEVRASGTGSPSDKLVSLGNATTFLPADIHGYDIYWRTLGFFGRFNYDFKHRYILTLTAREDADSKFLKPSRWGFFPGASVGWIVTEEPWVRIDNLDYLKVRASYGSTGNSASVGYFDAAGSFSAESVYNGNASIKPMDMPNESLSWETTNQMDFGAEFGLFNNRVYVSADYYDKHTSGLLYSKTLPNTTGYSSVWTNLGKVRFWGYELELTTKNIDHDWFRWDSRLVLSYNKNIVVSLPDNGIEHNRVNGLAAGDGTFYGGIAEGEPLYRFYGYKVDHILQNAQEVANARKDENALRAKRPGDYEWVDRNGDGIINAQDQFELGVTVPWLTGGLSNDFSFRNLTLSVYLDWAIGHSIMNDHYAFSFYPPMYGQLTTDIKKCWTAEGDNTKFARFDVRDAAWGAKNYGRASDVVTQKGDYLCIREVSLQYSLPDRVVNKLPFTGMTVSLSGNNLYYFTAVKGGVSPEIGTSSTSVEGYNNYPPIRRFSLGVRLTF